MANNQKYYGTFGTLIDSYTICLGDFDLATGGVSFFPKLRPFSKSTAIVHIVPEPKVKSSWSLDVPYKWAANKMRCGGGELKWEKENSDFSVGDLTPNHKVLIFPNPR